MATNSNSIQEYLEMGLNYVGSPSSKKSKHAEVKHNNGISAKSTVVGKPLPLTTLGQNVDNIDATENVFAGTHNEQPSEVLGLSADNEGLPYIIMHLQILQKMMLFPSWSQKTTKTSVFLMVSFFITNGLALFEAMFSAKHYVMKWAKKGMLFHYLTSWYKIQRVLLSLCAATIAINGRNLELLNMTKSNSSYENKNKKVSKILTVMAISSIILAFLMATSVDLLVEDFTLKEIVEIHSRRLAEDIFLWEKQNYTEKSEDLETKYGTYNGMSLVLGIIAVTLRFIANIQYFASKDIMFATSLSLYSHGRAYQEILQTSEILDCSVEGQLWNEYDKMHKFSKRVNKWFGPLFFLTHINNWLYAVYFILHLIDDEYNVVFVAMSCLKLAKILLAYVLSAKTANAGKNILHRLHTEATNFNDPNLTTMKVNLLFIRQKMDYCPVGIGGGVLVDKAFLIKFVGSVFSSFLMVKGWKMVAEDSV